MNRTTIRSVHVFNVLAFAAAIVSVLIRDVPLCEAGAAMDNLLSDVGREISQNQK